MKYYIKDLSIPANQLNKLQNTLYYETTQQHMLLADCGYFTVYNNQYYHHFIDTNDLENESPYWVVDNYLDKHTLYVDNSKWIKRRADAIPANHVNITATNHIYKLNEKCNVSFVVEKNKKGEIVDVYFSSYLNENDFSFQETLSYLLAKLI
jgi:hypothetical protein